MEIGRLTPIYLIGFSFVVFLEVNAPVFGADADLAICEKLSRPNLMDTRNITIASEKASQDFDYVCQKTEERTSRAQDVSSGGSIGYGGFSLGLSGASSAADASSRINDVCREGKKSYLDKFTYNEDVKNGQYVVNLVNNCLNVVTSSRVESIFGYTVPSISSDESFNIELRYRVGTDFNRPWKLVGIKADPAAKVQCDDTNLTLEAGATTQAAAVITCSKAKGVAVTGSLVFSSIEDKPTKRDIKFTVSSPAGEEIIRSKLKEEYDAKIDDLRQRLEEQKKSFAQALRNDIDSVKTAFEGGTNGDECIVVKGKQICVGVKELTWQNSKLGQRGPEQRRVEVRYTKQFGAMPALASTIIANSDKTGEPPNFFGIMSSEYEDENGFAYHLIEKSNVGNGSNIRFHYVAIGPAAK